MVSAGLPLLVKPVVAEVDNGGPGGVRTFKLLDVLHPILQCYRRDCCCNQYSCELFSPLMGSCVVFFIYKRDGPKPDVRNKTSNE